MPIYVIRQENMKNFIFLWDQPIKKPDNNPNNKHYRRTAMEYTKHIAKQAFSTLFHDALRPNMLIMQAFRNPPRVSSPTPVYIAIPNTSVSIQAG
jgi:hypothetical protein